MSKIENEWAWSQVEALADGSLAAPEAARMERAMAEDPALAAASTFPDRGRLWL